MDRAEAIKRLEWLRMVGNHVDRVTLGSEDMGYFDMAIAALREQEECEIRRHLKRFDIKEPRKTNADRIRVMTDEEMVEFIEEHCIESLCDIVCGGQCRAIRTFEKTSDEVCKDIIRNWLQQPCGGADHE